MSFYSSIESLSSREAEEPVRAFSEMVSDYVYSLTDNGLAGAVLAGVGRVQAREGQHLRRGVFESRFGGGRPSDAVSVVVL